MIGERKINCLIFAQPPHHRAVVIDPTNAYFKLLITIAQCFKSCCENMAYPSKPKNHPVIPDRGNRPGYSGPSVNKPHPGYSGKGPAPPGPKMPEGVSLSRSPPAADRYLPDWTNRNYYRLVFLLGAISLRTSSYGYFQK